MKRKLLIGAACLAFCGLAILVVMRGGKQIPRRIPRGEPEHNTMSVVVDLPKTNSTSPDPAPAIKVR